MNTSKKSMQYLALLISLAVMSAVQSAPSEASLTSNSDNAIAAQKDKQAASLETVNINVADAFNKVKTASKLIKEGKTQEAIDALAYATGKFDIALAANPEISMIPVMTEINVTELATNPESVRTIIEKSQELLAHSKVQAARLLLSPLQDDITSSTQYLPLETYPQAIKQASNALVDGDNEKALNILAVALNTIVTKTSVVPLSLIRAQSLIMSASKLDKENDKEKALSLLKSAQDELALAETLGYSDEDSVAYQSISTQIKNLEDNIRGPNTVEKMYQKLKATFTDLLEKNSEAKNVK